MSTASQPDGTNGTADERTLGVVLLRVFDRISHHAPSDDDFALIVRAGRDHPDTLVAAVNALTAPKIQTLLEMAAASCMFDDPTENTVAGEALAAMRASTYVNIAFKHGEDGSRMFAALAAPGEEVVQIAGPLKGRLALRKALRRYGVASGPDELDKLVGTEHAAQKAQEGRFGEGLKAIAFHTVAPPARAREPAAQSLPGSASETGPISESADRDCVMDAMGFLIVHHDREARDAAPPSVDGDDASYHRHEGAAAVRIKDAIAGAGVTPVVRDAGDRDRVLAGLDLMIAHHRRVVRGAASVSEVPVDARYHQGVATAASRIKREIVVAAPAAGRDRLRPDLEPIVAGAGARAALEPSQAQPASDAAPAPERREASTSSVDEAPGAQALAAALSPKARGVLAGVLRVAGRKVAAAGGHLRGLRVVRAAEQAIAGAQARVRVVRTRGAGADRGVGR